MIEKMEYEVAKIAAQEKPWMALRVKPRPMNVYLLNMGRKPKMIEEMPYTKLPINNNFFLSIYFKMLGSPKDPPTKHKG